MSNVETTGAQAPQQGVERLTKKDLSQVLLRYVMSAQICFNYETMQSAGWVWSMHPAMKKLYPDDQVLSEKYKSYYKFFNTHPWFGRLILMAALAIETTRDPDATQTAVDVRTGLMGPLAGLGDSIVWVLLPTVVGAIASYSALEGSLVGWFMAIAVNILLWLVFWRLSYTVYDKGISFITEKSRSLAHLTDACAILGIIVIGALTVSTVDVHLAISWTVGDLTQNLDELLNGILPSFMNLVTMLAIYLGLDIKGMSPGKMVWIVMIVAIVLGALGICA
ncbi:MULTISPECIES: PTS system mannose/fructose/sorbose family transporter subunit IID [Atopobiaceae]|uniref:PTS system mannose/fructose/sorbose family transporter subunit IID n=1 Tax=Atopobiaceae TaxID=1643824 RepID=UPI000B3887FE|nr:MULTISPECIES: PTS system mannose/fructose/sorbose family transporter subunit IID [Atopobiaceae]MCR8908449.1 PTS system mannose/fructose/sorbose family transporter subunit IID [Thermophilibacter sp. ET337]OUO33093.1 hypothetical protein B5F85_03345 [Olsenella sp. An293]